METILEGTDWLKEDLMKNPADKVMYNAVFEAPAMTYVWNHPGAAEEALYAITQEFLGSDMSAQEAADKYEAAVEKWRTENPEAVENFKIWANEDFPFLND